MTPLHVCQLPQSPTQGISMLPVSIAVLLSSPSLHPHSSSTALCSVFDCLPLLASPKSSSHLLSLPACLGLCLLCQDSFPTSATAQLWGGHWKPRAAEDLPLPFNARMGQEWECAGKRKSGSQTQSWILQARFRGLSVLALTSHVGAAEEQRSAVKTDIGFVTNLYLELKIFSPSRNTDWSLCNTISEFHRNSTRHFNDKNSLLLQDLLWRLWISRSVSFFKYGQNDVVLSSLAHDKGRLLWLKFSSR